jgi:hypothetical protein
MPSWLRMVILLRKLYEFEFKPAKYINATEILNIQEQYSISDKDQISLYILQTHELANIAWGEVDIMTVAFITLPSAQQEKIFKYIALDILLHQPSTIIDGLAVRNLFSLFECPYKQFSSYLGTRISQNTINNNSLDPSLFFTTITIEQIHELIFYLKNQYIENVEKGIQQRFLLKEANYSNSFNDIFNFDFFEAKLAVGFYVQHLWPNRLSLLRKLHL